MSWFNLGAWEGASGYEEACEALARRLADLAELGPGQRVLDVGAGGGLQCALFLRERGVARVDAVEPDPRARAAASSLGLAGLHVHAGSGADLSLFPAASFDRVVSLDAAYFVDTREDLLREALRVLRPRGRLAAIDLALTRPARVRGLARLAGVPRANLWRVEDVEGVLRTLGFDEVRVERMEDVLEGFARWATSGLEAARVFPARLWPQVAATAIGLRCWRPLSAVGYVGLRAPAPR